MQFHTGYGDADADLRLADPLHLAPLMRDVPDGAGGDAARRLSVDAQSAVLAGTYRNAYVDVSYAIPFLTAHELLAITHEALGARRPRAFCTARTPSASPSSTGWGRCAGGGRSAPRWARWWTRGDLGPTDALDLAELILRGNAERIYGL